MGRTGPAQRSRTAASRSGGLQRKTPLVGTNVDFEQETAVCPVCMGRGEVEAGIEVGKDVGTEGDRTLHAIGPNPAAIGAHGEIWFLDVNPLVPLWSTAVCGVCRGKGFLRNQD